MRYWSGRKIRLADRSRGSRRFGLILLCCLLLVGAAVALARPVAADEDAPTLTVSGYIRNGHGEGIAGVIVDVSIIRQAGAVRLGPGRPTRSDEEGAYILRLSLTAQEVAALRLSSAQVIISAGKPGYADEQATLQAARLAVEGNHFFSDADIVLAHKPTPAVVLAAVVLIGVYLLISLERMHRTVAALLGAAVILAITHIAGHFNPDFVILPFERAITYIDLNVIFLLMAMMVLVTITARTGVFQWLAVVAFRLAKGSTWRLVVLLMIATAVLSAFLDNVTTMLLVVPVTLEIAILLQLDAFSLLLPEVFASNLGGAATLIGDPPNLLIGSYADLGFGAFLQYMLPASILAMVGLIVMTRIMYAGRYPQSTPQETADLLARLEREFSIKDPRTLRQALIVFAGIIILFLASSALHMEPSVPALLGMALLLIWTEADIAEELERVEWPSLLFFIGLFIVIGGAVETGVIEALADALLTVAAGNLTVAVIVIVWGTALASMVIDNIPITATMLPVVAYLSQHIPGVQGVILFWALALGACFGGNGTIVGASANIVTAGLAERAGYSLTFFQFTRKGLPVAIMSLVVATIWLLGILWLT